MNNQSKHTPGPWNSEHRAGSIDIWSGGGFVHQIACINPYAGDSGTTTETDESNARLIAAAPEMLDALKAVADFDLTSDIESYGIQKATENLVMLKRSCRVLIARAEGQDSK